MHKIRNQVSEPESSAKRDSRETKTVTVESWMSAYIERLDYKG